MEQLELTNICTYWPTNPAFNPKRVLLRRLFFINEDRTKYVSVGFYPARDSLPSWGRSERRWAVTLILSDELVDVVAEGLPMLRGAMCNGDSYVGFAGARAVNFG